MSEPGYPIGEESLLADPDSCPADGDHFTAKCVAFVQAKVEMAPTNIRRGPRYGLVSPMRLSISASPETGARLRK
jgi:hypothetical protein